MYKTVYEGYVQNNTIVLIESMDSNDIVDDSEYWYQQEEHRKALNGKYARLKLIEQVDTEKLHLSKLLQYGLKAAPQGPVKISNDLAKYIDENINEYKDEGVFPESDIPNDCYEGAKYQICVIR